MSPLAQVLLVAGRDFTQRARSRVFLLGMGLVLVLVLVAGPLVSAIGGASIERAVGVVGNGEGDLGQTLLIRGEGAGLEVTVRPYDDPGDAMQAVRDGELDAAVLIVRAGSDMPEAPTVVWPQEPDPRLDTVIRLATRRVQQDAIAARLGLSAGEQDALLSPPRPEELSLDPAEERQVARQGVAFLAMLVLYGSVVVFGQFVMFGVMEEKSSRVVEVLLSRVRPAHLLAGKVLGIGALALLQIVLVAGAAYMTLARLLDEGSAMGTTVPDIDLTLLAPLVGWFVLGFAFYAVLYAALGSTVTRQEDAQSAALLPLLVVLPSYVVGVVATAAPDQAVVRAGSLLPPVSPFVMPVRAAATDVPAWEVGLSVVLLLLATYGMVRLAGRVYEGAILSLGRRVRLRDAWRTGRQGGRQAGTVS